MATVVWRCRVLYNTAREQRSTAWHRCPVSSARYQQEAAGKASRAAFPDDAAIHRHVLQDVLARARRATTSQACVHRRQRGDKAGLPRFQGRERCHRFPCKQYGNGAQLENGCLVLAKIGRVAVRWSRPLAGTPKTGTLAQEADGWDVAIACAAGPCTPLPLPRTGHETGSDLGLASVATLADGSQSATPRIFRVVELNLTRAQRRVSRRKKGSTRRRKAVRRLAKQPLQVKRQRTACHHTSALVLVQQYDTLYHEDLQTANLLKNHHRATSITAAAWRGFLGSRSFTAAYAGKTVVAVPPADTAQACSGCGVIVSKGLSVRWPLGPDCGTSRHRDHNAALNSLR